MILSYSNIESWASRIGYVVERSEDGKYTWHKENTLEFHDCFSVEDVIEQILVEIKSSYFGGRL